MSSNTIVTALPANQIDEQAGVQNKSHMNENMVDQVWVTQASLAQANHPRSNLNKYKQHTSRRKDPQKPDTYTAERSILTCTYFPKFPSPSNVFSIKLSIF